MRYLVMGVRTEHVSVYVDADSEDEAIEEAMECYPSDIDVWDVDTNWYSVQESD